MSSVTANSRMIYAFPRIVAEAWAVTTLRTGAEARVASGKVATGWPSRETSGIRSAHLRSAA